jgi:hypothetical protein
MCETEEMREQVNDVCRSTNILHLTLFDFDPFAQQSSKPFGGWREGHAAFGD